MQRLLVLALLAILFCAPAALALTYITLPTDRELIEQSGSILIGTIEGSYVQAAKSGGGFETVYEVRVQRTLKGGATRDELVRVASRGGEMGRFGSYTPGAAHFEAGEKILLFLSEADGQWTVTHMALGSFRFGTTLEGERLLVRDLAEVESFDEGVSTEPLRSEEKFLQFIGDVAAGRAEVAEDYFIKGEARPTRSGRFRPIVNSEADPKRYTQMGTGTGSEFGVRWPTSTIAGGLSFFKQASSNLTGSGDGGVSVIQSGLASWTNDALSNVTLNYAGTSSALPGAGVGGCSNICDFINVIQYNAVISSAGLASIVYFTTAGGAAGAEYRQIVDADIQISSSLNSSSLGIPSIMTHELGHAIGFRHSNASPASPNDGAPSGTVSCVSPPDDCVSTTNGAIMMWAVSGAGNGFNLQPWDQRAVRSVYPGSAPAAPTGVVATATSGTNVTITWNAVGGASGYEVHRSNANDFAAFSGVPVCTAGAGVLTCNDTSAVANQAYLYKVRVGTTGLFSATDFAVTVVFTDPTLTVGSTVVKAAHFNELRTAANALRTLAKIGAFSFTDTLNSSTTVKALHLTELRTAIDAARSAMSFGAGSYTDAISAGSTPIKAVHITDLRNAVK